MGVPAFYRWLSQKYPKTVVDAVERYEIVDNVHVPTDTTAPNPNGVEFDNLYLDMNGIIHPCVHPEDKPAPATEDDMFRDIFEYIDRIFAIVRPRKVLYMGIDGVAPRAKMNQQRSRRFKTSKEASLKSEAEEKLRQEWISEGRNPPPKKEKAFDSNVITPGTLFMHKLALNLRFYVQHRLSTDPGWRNLEVIFSDASCPGEGEHKIMQFIRLQRLQPGYNPNTTHVLYGLDADLIMLGLASHEAHFFILREEVMPRYPMGRAPSQQSLAPAEEDAGDKPQLKPYQLLQIFVLREYLDKELFVPSLPFAWDLENVIDDFVFMCFFVGNDFLPHMPSLDIREGAIDALMLLYKTMLPGWGGYLTTNGDINFSRVQGLLTQLGQLEDAVFTRRKEMEESRNRRNPGNTVPAGQDTAALKRKFEQSENVSVASVLRSKLMAEAELGVSPPLKKRRVAEADGEPRPDGVTELAPISPVTGPVGDSTFDTAPSGASATPLTPVTPLTAPLDRSVLTADSVPTPRSDFDDADHETPSSKVAAVSSAPKSADVDFESLLKQRERKENEILNPVDDVDLGRPGWKSRYYEKKFDVTDESAPAFLKDIRDNYIEGLKWVFDYYYRGCPSWVWYFRYHYAPFASDLVSVDSVPMKYPSGRPFYPFEQLLAVLPPSSSHALPPAFRKLMTDPSSSVIDFYPVDFEEDLNGKKFRWQAVALLPFVDEQRLQAAVRSVDATLTDEERRRNRFGPELVYVQGVHSLARQIHEVHAAAIDLSGIARMARRVAIDPTLGNNLFGFIASYDDHPVTGMPLRALMGDELQVNKAASAVFYLPDARGVHHLTRLLPGAVLPAPRCTPDDFSAMFQEREKLQRRCTSLGQGGRTRTLEGPGQRMIAHATGSQFLFGPGSSHGDSRGGHANDRGGYGYRQNEVGGSYSQHYVGYSGNSGGRSSYLGYDSQPRYPPPAYPPPQGYGYSAPSYGGQPAFTAGTPSPYSPYAQTHNALRSAAFVTPRGPAPYPAPPAGPPPNGPSGYTFAHPAGDGRGLGDQQGYGNRYYNNPASGGDRVRHDSRDYRR